METIESLKAQLAKEVGFTKKRSLQRRIDHGSPPGLVKEEKKKVPSTQLPLL